MAVFARRAFSLAAKRPPRLVVVGGTHGNEYTGVWLAKELANKKLAPGVETFMANHAAIQANRRFVDEDLNRCFSREKLDGFRADGAATVEAARALEVDAALGPKGSDAAADLVVDLHTTTANMGITIICDAWCPFALRAAAYVQQQLKNPSDAVFGDVKIMYNAISDAEHAPYLASIGKRGLQIEVGPTPQGVVRWDVVDATRRALDAILELAEREAAGETVELPARVEAYSVVAGANQKLAWPVDEQGFPTAVPHESLQDRDWHPLRKGEPLWRDHEGNTVPYDGSRGDVITPIFINEGGYYYASSGRGIGVAEKTVVDVPKACDSF